MVLCFTTNLQFAQKFEFFANLITFFVNMCKTRDVFYVRRMEDLIKKKAKVNAYTMHIFGKIELLSIHGA